MGDFVTPDGCPGITQRSSLFSFLRKKIGGRVYWLGSRISLLGLRIIGVDL